MYPIHTKRLLNSDIDERINSSCFNILSLTKLFLFMNLLMASKTKTKKKWKYLIFQLHCTCKILKTLC